MDVDLVVLKLDPKMVRTLDLIVIREISWHDGDHDPVAQEKYRAARRLQDALNEAVNAYWEEHSC